jgi:hypothetical protein
VVAITILSESWQVQKNHNQGRLSGDRNTASSQRHAVPTAANLSDLIEADNELDNQ